MPEQHKPLSENDINVANKLGELHADMRTVKHDLANIATNLRIIGESITAYTNRQARNLGFFAGVSFILTFAAGTLIVLFRALFPHSGT